MNRVILSVASIFSGNIAAASGIHCLAAFHRGFAAMLAWRRRAAGSCARSGGMPAPVLAGFEG
jgi:hypothetical protein